MPNTRTPPDFFGIGTALTGGGRQLPELIRFQSLYRFAASFVSNRSIVSASIPDWLSHATRLPRSAPWECCTICRSCGIPPGGPVDLPCPPDDAVPSLPRHYGGLDATTDDSVPWRRFATVGLAFQAWAFRLTSPPKVPAVQRKSLKQDRAASMPDAIWPVSRHRPESRRNITRRFRRRLSTFDT